jgi:hypothetical protein
MRRSSGSASLNVRLLSLLASHLLLLLLLRDHVGVLLLLIEECPGLMGLLLQVLHIGDEADRVHNALVIEEHTCDLACGFAVVLLNDLIDIVTNFLATLVGFEALEALKIHTAHQRLGRLLLLLSNHLLLLLGNHLRVIRGHLRHLLLGSTGGSLRLLRRNRSSWGLLLLLLRLVSFTATTLAHVVSLSTTTTSTVVKLVTTRTTIVLALLTLTLVIIVIGASTLVALTSNLLAAVLAALVGENSSHKVLLNFLEATLLALLVQLLGGHPELD